MEAKYVPQKYEFSQRFAVNKFEAVETEPDLDRQGKPKKDTTNSEPIQITTPREKACVNADFKIKYKPSATSTPWEVADDFTPFSDGNGKKFRTKYEFSFEILTEWANNKAYMSGAGKKFYKGEWDIFYGRYLRQHFVIDLLQGLAPSPRIRYKLNPQCRDRISGNDFMYNSFGRNDERRHKHFKALLACCNTTIKAPSKEEFHNWKIITFVNWINYQCLRAWQLGCYVAVNEMTMRFKGHHRDKLRITYKAEGNGFQANALCDDGYCYQMYV